MPSAQKSKIETGSQLATEKITPFPDTPNAPTPDRIRPELNLEKWPIWKPSKSKNKPVERKLQREIKLEDGKTVIAEVEVGYTNKGELTTEDQKTYYALIKLWEDSGKSTERPVFFSQKGLSKLLGKGWGTNVIESQTQSLTRLRITPFIWTNSYQEGDKKRALEVLEPFTILSELKIIRSKVDGHVTKQAGYFKFNDHLLRNLEANITKPVFFDVVIGFKSEIAQLLYTYLDLILADKTFYERRTKELLDDLGITGKEYYKPSARKRVLERAIVELQSAPLTTGRIASITLEETKDEKDYKLVVRKGKLVAVPINYYHEQETPEPVSERIPQEGREAVAGDLPQPQKPVNEELLNQAKELVTYFYQVFHSGKNFQIISKAIGQAISLITQYGFEASKHIVDFAHREAPKTNFDIQTFGGIIQYSSRALAEYQEKKHAAQARTEIEACSLCSSSGFRLVEKTDPHTGLKHEAAKRCTHDPEIEAKYPSKLSSPVKPEGETSDPTPATA